MAKRIFISSTFNDLEGYRKTVRDAVRELGAVDVSMEHFGARDDRPKDECIKLIREQSDVFVGIIAHRYGYIPDGDSISILEAEYDAATAAQLPRFIYILKHEVAWPVDLKDSGESAGKLSAFKQRLLKRHIVQGFTNKDDVATHVASNLGRYFSEGIVASDGGHRGVLHEPPADWVPPLNKNRWRYKVVGFDLDGTLLRGENYQFSWELIWNNLKFAKKIQQGLSREYRNKAKEAKDDRQRIMAYRTWCQKACGHFMTRKVTRKQLADMFAPLALTKNCRQALQQMRHEGFVLAVISGGVNVLLEEKMPDYRELFDFVFINELLFDRNGALHDVVATEYDFEGKAEALSDICKRVGCHPKEEAAFVGDAFNDETIMLTAGLSIAYPPKDEVVGGIAVSIKEDNLDLIRQMLMQE